MINRNRTPSKHVCYGLYLYFSGLSSRQTSKRLALSNETMYRFGTGFKSTIHKKVDIS
ncbi:MAG: hypothetical protein L0H53_08610 [Candidatus Nitrosocosmicus sp.]|nr:hypothetical protein [Candidatus Nitrosocosmicus sp.]